MRRKNLYILTLVFCFVLVPAFYTFMSASAQTTGKTAPTPTPAANKTPPTMVSPTAAPTPEPDETITIDTEVVQMNVRVIDRNNRPINNLRQDDFKVYEDNVLQPIDSFTKAEVPTNYAMVIDNSGSLRLQLDKVIEASKIIVGTNKPDDETSIVRFVSSSKIKIMQDFTSNKADLYDALDDMFIEGGQTTIIDAVYLAAQMTDEYEKIAQPER